MATVTINSARTFRDLDLSFTIHPIKKDINIHKNEYAVINSVKNLVLLNFYEKPFQPEIGSNIRRLLFENIDSIVASQIEKSLGETISNFEPRVQMKKINVLASQDENGYNVTMEFFIINNPSPISIDFFLQRIR